MALDRLYMDLSVTSINISNLLQMLSDADCNFNLDTPPISLVEYFIIHYLVIFGVFIAQLECFPFIAFHCSLGVWSRTA